ncbi:MAG: DUF937 domain-containing protein [Sphingopyxis sp.]|jgi:hypothetical protein|uniref:DUF937 domain-containing protein n=1 Tax=unclassified Sphingopyxis TaxID=2614943 RepID=UPI00072FCBD6|nr:MULTISPECIES: DUF937 domain-containing protein [unclassified Sphingopyxis]KTE02662.1 hypothetical protein ATE78_10120 [Sphingopyxis sp. H012]KTE11223.1 hypothetical protein ATE70_09810 [Sphingopyxis sp. H053]KTE12178.1 hypothetical protein ATE76_11295 [Sphingopyxis sp. H093]KTE30704.1 hypothetical protein ATE75_03215 [Sphingopyxis sp. H080]KTE35711.1 hypothetical protein ATE68_07580 [Sphingopyxis sp. H038]
MNLTDILAQAGGIESMAKELGIPPAMAKQGADALLPAILGGFKKQAQSGGGVEGLGGLLGQLGGGGLLDSVLGSQPTEVSQGNDVLGQIFGSKDVSRTVAGQAAAQTGIDSGILKQMLPMLAMMAAGYMAKQGGQGGESGGLSGGLGGMLGNVLGGAMGGGAAPSAGGLGGSLGGLGKMLDMDGDGNPLDDIMGMVNKMRG